MVSQRGSRREQADRRREQLLEVGLRLFAQRGYDATTIADIASEAGVAHGLVYHYFPSKEALLNAILARFSFLSDLRELLAIAPGRSVHEVLPEIATRFSAMVRRRSDLLGLVIRESRTNPDIGRALAGVMREGTVLLGSYLEERIVAGELRRHDVTVTARAIFHAIIAGHLAGSLPRDYPPQLVDVILRGILANGHDKGR
jgi:AcrR family transcriptional regulator